MMGKGLEAAIQQIKKVYGPEAIRKMSDHPGEVPAIPTGCLSFDIASGIGGIPRGRITEAYGPEGAGKSSFALHLVAQVQAAGGNVGYIDVENCLNADYAAALGVVLDDMYIAQPDCISGEEFVFTNQGLMRVADAPRWLDVSADVDGQVRLVPAKKVDAGEKTVYLLKTCLGTIEASKDHRIKTLEGFKSLSDLTLEDYIEFTSPIPQVSLELEYSLTNDDALMVGLLVGDGSYARSPIRLTAADSGITNWVARYVETNFADCHLRWEGRYAWVVTSKKRKHDPSSFTKKFKALLGDAIAPYKAIPKIIFNSSPSVRAALIAGLWASDGCVDLSHQLLEFDNTSKAVVYGASALLWSLDIPHKIYSRDDNRKKTYHRMYRIVISSKEGIEGFSNQIKLIGKKEVALSLIDRSKKESFVRFPRTFWSIVKQEAKRLGITLTDLSQRVHGHTDSRHHFNFDRDISIDVLTRINKELNSRILSDILLSRLYWTRPIEIRELGQAPCFDFIVPGPRSFIANNMIVHNSGEEGLTIAETLIRSGEVDLVVVDSVDALLPQSVIDGEMEDRHVADLARLMSQGCRKLAAVVRRSKAAFLFINQLRSKIATGPFAGGPGNVTSGGRALRYYASMRLEIKSIGQIKDSDDLQIGKRTQIEIVKNKCASPFKKCEFDLIFGKGIAFDHDLLDEAVKAKRIERSGAWYNWENDKIGQGRDAAARWFSEHPDEAATLRSELLEEALPKQEEE